MIDGITVLNIVEKISYAGGFSPGFIISLIVFGLLIMIFTSLTILEDACFIYIVFILAGISLIVNPILYKNGGEKIITTQYQVTINDSVSLTEFTDKYNIIEQNGQIYTITEKTADTN